MRNMKTKYFTCTSYCSTIGRKCTGAWEEWSDTCRVKSTENCHHNFGIYTSDAICECGAVAICDELVILTTPWEEYSGNYRKTHQVKYILHTKRVGTAENGIFQEVNGHFVWKLNDVCLWWAKNWSHWWVGPCDR